MLQEDASEFLDESKLKDLVAKYSEFINFPIYLYSSKEVSNLPHTPLSPTTVTTLSPASLAISRTRLSAVVYIWPFS